MSQDGVGGVYKAPCFTFREGVLQAFQVIDILKPVSHRTVTGGEEGSGKQITAP